MKPTKLHLKRTPAEQAARDIKRARRAARKAKRSKKDFTGSSSRSEDPQSSQQYDSDEEYGPQPAPHPHNHKPDSDEIFAQMEEDRFREKMWGALGDDERLDSLEADMNSYAHVPRRWRSGGMDRMDDETTDPHMMEDEDYAEWVRIGMWKKQHADEYAEQLRQEAERAARRKREKELRAEAERMEKQAEEERRQRRSERHRRRREETKQLYTLRWRNLLSGLDGHEGPQKELTFDDIPWPIYSTQPGPLPPGTKGKQRVVEIDVEEFTSESISTFLLESDIDSKDAMPTKERRDILRETMLRFHPDKFEGRILSMVCERDRERVREGAGRVVRALNDLMAGH